MAKYLMFLSLFFLGACEKEKGDSLTELPKDPMGKNFKLTSSPQWEIECQNCEKDHSAAGVNGVFLRVKSNGKPVDGLQMKAITWMTSMGHGSSANPKVEEMGSGTYKLSNIVFTMPGAWDIQLELKKGDVIEYQFISLKAQGDM